MRVVWTILVLVLLGVTPALAQDNEMNYYCGKTFVTFPRRPTADSGPVDPLTVRKSKIRGLMGDIVIFEKGSPFPHALVHPLIRKRIIKCLD